MNKTLRKALLPATGLLGLAILFWGITGCQNGKVPTTVPSPSPKAMAESPQVLADCWRTVRVNIWEDKNGDGIQNDGEGPISGLGYQINGIFAELMTDREAQSDGEGKINLSLWSPGNCPKGDFTLEITNIGNRRATTPNPQPFTLLPGESSYQADFGFQEIPK